MSGKMNWGRALKADQAQRYGAVDKGEFAGPRRLEKWADAILENNPEKKSKRNKARAKK
jgi:hypothetical protein